jgi:glycosyltransferase involved in cell wall biosynthesis
MLEAVVMTLAGRQTDHEVVSMTTLGEVGQRLRSNGIDVHALEMPRGTPDLGGLAQLQRLVKARRPAMLHTWMYHADLLGGLVAKWMRLPVMWCVRQSDVRAEKLRSQFLSRVINPVLSHVLPDAIVCCGQQARQIHIRYGYRSDRMIVIRNGFDLHRFRPNASARLKMRTRYAIPTEAQTIGMSARLHPMKDHSTFFRAASVIAREIPTSYFFLCGDSLNDGEPEVERYIRDAGIPRHRVVLAGRIQTMETIYPGLDLSVLSSKSGEGFPNVVGESMACGVPCVVTDVGDAAGIVGQVGRVVAPGASDALARAVIDLVNESAEYRRALQLQVRRRIEYKFSLPDVAAQYEAAYLALLNAKDVASGTW